MCIHVYIYMAVHVWVSVCIRGWVAEEEILIFSILGQHQVVWMVFFVHFGAKITQRVVSA